ncbi:MAG: hypothetical protein ABFD49_00770 [Armatimonadota bacterium]|nr:hypothetical protein [bacterium]
MITRVSRIVTIFAVIIAVLAAGVESFAQTTRPLPTSQAGVISEERPRIRIQREQAAAAALAVPVVSLGVKGSKSRATDINTLKYALIDKKTRVVTFVGYYDPTYATGAIPYSDILKDVINNPYPSFSLEPTPDQPAKFATMDKMITSDIARMNNDPGYCNEWANKLISLLLNDPFLAADNKRFMKHFGEGLGLTEGEFRKLFYGAQNMGSVPQDEWIGMASKMMRIIGLPNIAKLLDVFTGGGSTGDMQYDMCAALGLTSELEAIKANRDSGEISQEQFVNEGFIMCFSVMLRQMDYPERQLDSMAKSIRNGSQSKDVLTEAFSTQLSSYITDRFGEKIINGLVFSPDLMSRLYNLPLAQSELAFSNVPSDSVLGDILFKADYLLKTICSNPDLREQVPSHMTDMEFHQQEAVNNNYNIPSNAGAGIGSRLVPADVMMKVSPAGDVVEFGDAQVKMVGWVRSYLGNWDNESKNHLNSVVPKYADYVTQHYDEYARAFPELYRMNEVAKVVALARWAKGNGYTLAAGDASNAKIEHPKLINGFWSAVFQASHDKYSLTIIEEGGASFSADEGEDWVKPQTDVTVTSDVSKQLVASAILAGEAAGAAIGGDLEAAKDLADKSAMAMTGMIDLTKLPSLSDLPMPEDPASYAIADMELINEASDCLNTMKEAQKDLQHADSIADTSPDEAEKIRSQATKAQDDASARLNELMSSVATLKNNPSQASDVVVALKGSSGVVQPIQNMASLPLTTSQAAQTVVQPTDQKVGKPLDLEATRAKWMAELDEVNRKIEITKQTLLMLNRQILADNALYNDWEKMASDGMDKCKSTITDLFFDTTIGILTDRFKEINKVAQKLPPSEAEAIEKYRRLESLSTSMKDARDGGTFIDWLYRENKTDAEVYESIRDGIGQISGILSLDSTVPGMAWKYGSMTADLAYTFAQYYQAWNGIKASTDRTDYQMAQVKKFCEKLKELTDQSKGLRQKLVETSWKQ